MPVFWSLVFSVCSGSAQGEASCNEWVIETQDTALECAAAMLMHMPEHDLNDVSEPTYYLTCEQTKQVSG